MAQLSRREAIWQQMPQRQSRGKAVAVLGTAFGVLGFGAAFAFLPIAPLLTTIGFFMMMLGAVFLMALAGLFRGTPYHGRTGRWMNKLERQRKERERKKYSD